MTDIMMQIGDYPFSLGTAAYQTLKRKAAYRWQSQSRIGRKPARQFIGNDAETVQLSGMILPGFRGGTGQIDAMRAEAGKGAPLILVDGRGNVWGEWVIESVEETQSFFTSNGIGRKIMFDMEISEYGDDQLQAVSDQAVALA